MTDFNINRVGYAYNGPGLPLPHPSEMRLSCFQEYGANGELLFRTYNDKGMEKFDNFRPLSVYMDLEGARRRIVQLENQLTQHQTAN